MKFYVENRYGTAGMGDSFGFASVIEIEDGDDTYDGMRYDQTRSISGPYATRAEAKAVAEADNAIHDAYSDNH